MRILADPVPISRIFLALTNPRHDPLTTEDEAIGYLCESEDVWALARDIAQIGLNPLERVALIPIKGQKDAYTMAEGNRRLCALKLLADPDRAPARLRKGFASLAAQRPVPKTFPAVVFEDGEEVRPWLERMHNGAYDGRGRRPWNAEQQQRYSGSNKNKVAQAFLDYAEAAGLISAEDRKGKLTTVQRFLVNDVFREVMGLDQSNPDELARTRPPDEFATIAGRFIRDLIKGDDVNSRMNKPDIIKYARPLGSLPGVTATRIESEPLDATNERSQKKDRASRRQPRKPDKLRHIQYADKIASALKTYGNYKLSSLYHSVCTVSALSFSSSVALRSKDSPSTLQLLISSSPASAIMRPFIVGLLPGIRGAPRVKPALRDSSLSHGRSYCEEAPTLFPLGSPSVWRRPVRSDTTRLLSALASGRFLKRSPLAAVGAVKPAFSIS